MDELAALVVETLGYAAGLTVFVAFALRSVVSLRAVAIVSNVLFIAYALAGHLMPVLLLHALLLPLNLYRLRQALHPEPTTRPSSVASFTSLASSRRRAYRSRRANGRWRLNGTAARGTRRSESDERETVRLTVEFPLRAGTGKRRTKARAVNARSVDIDLARP